MKRIVEIALNIFGILMYGLLAALGALMVWVQSNDEAFKSSIEQAAQGEANADLAELNSVVSGLGVGGWIVILVAILSVIIGFVTIFLLKGDKQPKNAGIVLIITAVFGSILTLGAGLIPGIFFLIAGIMCLVRKPYKIIND